MVPSFQSETLSALTPTQVAQLSRRSGALNDTRTIGMIFERLEDGNAVENLAEFLTELSDEQSVGCSSTLWSQSELLFCPIVALSN